MPDETEGRREREKKRKRKREDEERRRKWVVVSRGESEEGGSEEGKNVAQF